MTVENPAIFEVNAIRTAVPFNSPSHSLPRPPADCVCVSPVILFICFIWTYNDIHIYKTVAFQSR